MRQMNNSLMSSLFADPFGGMFGGIGSMHHNLESIMGGHQGHMRPARHNMMMPFGMGMNRLLNTDHMPDSGLSYSSSSVYSMSSGPDGVPQVYQASSSMRQGPNGIRETRKTVQDSRTGTKQMAIGHHIGDRAHIIEKQQNMRTGSMEENQEFINLDDTEAEDFDREFQQKARSALGPSGGGGARRLERPEMLALPAPPSSSSK
jgi:myeloid leukemia factor 1